MLNPRNPKLTVFFNLITEIIEYSNFVQFEANMFKWFGFLINIDNTNILQT